MPGEVRSSTVPVRNVGEAGAGRPGRLGLQGGQHRVVVDQHGLAADRAVDVAQQEHGVGCVVAVGEPVGVHRQGHGVGVGVADLAVLVAALAHGDGLGGGHDPVAEHAAGEAVGGGLADGEPGEDRRPVGAHQPGGLGGVVGAGGHDAGVEVGEGRGHAPSLPDPAAAGHTSGALFTGCSRP